MPRRPAQPGAWARRDDGTVVCDACGKVFWSPAQYRFIGDEVLCRNARGCATRQAIRRATARHAQTGEGS